MLKINNLTKIILTLFSAFLISMVSPNFFTINGYGLLSFIALVPIILVFYSCKSLKEHFIFAFIFGFSFVCIAHYWLWFFEDYRVATLGGAALTIGVETAINTGFVFATKRLKPTIRALLFACIWALAEHMKGTGDVAFPWALISYAFYDVPVFNQIIDLTGLAYLSFILALTNAIIAEIIIAWQVKPFKNLILLVICLVSINLIYGTLKILEPSPKIKRFFSMLLVQQNDDVWENNKKSIEPHVKLVKKYFKDSPSKKPDIILSGETITYSDPRLSYYYDKETKKTISLSNFVKEINIPQLIAAPIKGTWGHYNATSLIDKNGKLLKSYAKQWLVPAAEGVPWIIEFSFVNKIFDHFGWYTGWEKGKLSKIFTLPTKEGNIKFYSPVCYEDAFAIQTRSAVLDGAEIFLNQSNDSWSRTVSSEKQHLVASIFRTIETRRPLVRNTNGGITSYINEKGFYQILIEPFTTATYYLSVPIAYYNITLYAFFGDYFIVIFMVVILYFTRKVKCYEKSI